MRKDTQIELLERLLHAERGLPAPARDFRLDVGMYTSPEIARAERRVLFRSQPLVVAHASEIASPGDYVTLDVDDVPIAVVRGDDGIGRAFVNACRHRGTRLLTEP